MIILDISIFGVYGKKRSNLYRKSILKISITRGKVQKYYGFYTQLMLQIMYLRKCLKDKNLLEIVNSEKGNIYSLIYDNTTRRRICSGLYVLSVAEQEAIKQIASELRKTIINSDNNVYPKSSDRINWYNSLQVLYEFCEFIEHDNMQGYTNVDKENPEDTECKHIKKCKKLIKAMKYIQMSIAKENY